MAKLFIILLSAILYNSSGYAQQYDKIVVDYVDFNIESIISIKCNDFDKVFRNEMNRIIIVKPSEIEKFVKKLENFAPDSSKGIPDVRMRIRLFKNNCEERVICLDQFKMISNDRIYKVRNELLTYLMTLKRRYNVKCQK